MLLRIVAPPAMANGYWGFVAGVVVGERAAPIIAWMARRTETQIRTYCARRGWAVDEVRGE